MTLAAEPRPAAATGDVLHAIQAPVGARLEAVTAEMERVVTGDAPLLAQVARHLLAMKGKMFRPTLVLLSSAIDDRPEERAVALAATLEVLHLATLVHDDAVDHSVLRRGMPTINALFSHQVSVIMATSCTPARSPSSSG